MANSLRALQYLGGLRAFEVAARHKSFSRAAEELNITQTAVSRSVRVLEERLGFPLFERSANSLTLTAQGERLGSGLTTRFSSIAELVSEITALRTTRNLTVGVGSTFAVRWLIPRLSSFHDAHPDVEVRIAMANQRDSFRDDWTCSIRFDDADWTGYVLEPLFEAQLAPVCSPAIARRLHCPADLRRETILSVNGTAGDWDRWLAAADVEPLDASLSFASNAMALQAALDEIGVAMGLLPYVSADLRAGRLVTPFSRTVPSGRPWALIYKPFRRESSELQLFRDWLLEEAATPLR
jgi:LysR family glycine cleavage system transcriptional activator/LysR family transcriptional regulator of beta-lactamase